MDLREENDNEYYENSFLNLKKEFTAKEEALLAKLGIVIEDRNYSENEFDEIDEIVFSFYIDEDDQTMIDEDYGIQEFPEDVDMDEYKSLLKKLKSLHNKYNI